MLNVAVSLRPWVHMDAMAAPQGPPHAPNSPIFISRRTRGSVSRANDEPRTRRPVDEAVRYIYELCTPVGLRGGYCGGSVRVYVQSS